MKSRKLAANGIVSLFILASLVGITITPGVGAAPTVTPTMIGAEFLDRDSNGLIDSVLVEWDDTSGTPGENTPNPDSIVPSEFWVGGTGTGVQTTGCVSTSGTPECDVTSSPAITEFFFPERPAWTTGITPTFQYVTPGTLTNDDGSATTTVDGPASAHGVPSGGLTEQIAPELAGLVGVAGSDKVYAFFTEDIVTTETAGQFPVCVSSATSSVDSNDITTAKVLSTGGNIIEIDFDQNLLASDLDGDGSNDLEIIFAETSGPAGSKICTSNVVIEDANGNSMSSTAVTQAVHDGTSWDARTEVVAFRSAASFTKANQGSPWVLLDFGIGLTNNGAALGKNDFSYVNNAGGQTGAGAIDSVLHAAGSNYVLVKLNNDLTNLDIANDLMSLNNANVALTGESFAQIGIQLATDSSLPYIVSASTYGLAGQITHLNVELSEDLALPAACTYANTIFGVVDTSGAAAGLTVTPVSVDPTTACSTSTHSDSFSLAIVQPTPPYATDSTFKLSYEGLGSGGTHLEDVASNLLQGTAGIPVVDKALPYLNKASTQDLDGDGKIDAIKLEYSEPIDFSSLDEADFALDTQSLTDGYTLTGTSDGSGVNDDIAFLTVNGPGTVDTDYAPHVNAMSLAFTSGNLADLAGNLAPAQASVSVADGALPVITSAIASVGGSTIQVSFSEPVGGSGSSGTTLVAGDFSYFNNGAGASQQINSIDSHSAPTTSVTLRISPAFAQTDLNLDRLSPVVPVVSSGIGIVDQAQNGALAVDETFGAGNVPTIVSVETLDAFTGAPTTSPANGPDGIIDLLKVTFSENMEDGASCGAFIAGEWAIEINGEATTGTSILREDDLTASGCTGNDDAVWTIGFTAPASPVEDWSTAATPTLEYTNSGNDNVFALASSVPLASATEASTDGAAPYLLTAGANDGDSQIVLTFSEPASGTGAQNKFVFADFDYVDGGGAGPTDFRPVIPAHTTPTKTLIVDVPVPISATDLTADSIGPVSATVSDAAGNAADAHAQLLQDNLSPTITAVDLYDHNADGTADSIRVTFSEDLSDGTLCANLDLSRWTVKDANGQTVTTTLQSAAANAGTGAPCAAVNDDVVYLEFSAQQLGDAVFTVDYDGTTGTPIQDGVGNTISSAVTGLAVQDKVSPTVVSMKTQDLDRDGKIDGILIEFTEPVDDASFDKDEWTFPSYPVTGLGTGIAGDKFLTLRIQEGAGFDTDKVFTSTIDFATGSLADLNGNAMGSFTGASAADGAGAVVVNINAIVGTEDVFITFSETITSLPNLGDFIYYDNDGQGATVFASVTATGNQVHLTIDPVSGDVDQLTNSDLANDEISVQAGFVDAASPPVSSGFGKRLLDGTPSDSIPPSQVTNLQVTPGVNELTITWTAPSETDTSQYDIRIATTVIADATAFNAAQGIQFNGLGDAATIPNPTPGATETVTITGLTAGTTYFFALVSEDTVGNQATISNSPSGTPLAPDTTAPASITDLTTTVVSANSITLSWTAPGDDGTVGTVTSYEVIQGTAALTDADFGTATVATVTFAPATIAAAGATQTAIVSGLDPATTYHFAVRGVDEVGNEGTSDSASGTTNAPDTTAPTGTLVITSATHTANVESMNNDPSFSWTGLTDAESTISYEYLFTTDASATLTAGSGTTITGTSQSFTDVADGTHYFHVLGTSQGGSSSPETFVIVVKTPGGGVTGPTTQQAADLSKDIKLTVTRDGDNNVITWDNSGVDLTDVESMEIWVFNSPGKKVSTILGTDIESGSFTHSGTNAKEGSSYLTLFTLTGSVKSYTGAAPDDDDFTTTSVDAETDSDDEKIWEKSWFWPVVIAIIVLVVLLILILIILKVARSGKNDGDDEEAFGWDEEKEEESSFDGWTEPAAPSAAEDIDLRCPNCATEFHVHGVRPIETTCPGCQVAGTIE